MLHSRCQLAVEDHARGVEILIVHTDGQDEMFPFAVGNLLAPRHLLPCFQRGPHIGEIKGLVVVHLVGLAHVGIKKVEGLLFRRSDGRPAAL